MPKRDPIIESLVSKQPWYVVLRRCTVSGYNAERGEVIDTSGLRSDRLDSLVNRRYLFMMPYGIKPPKATVGPDDVERRMLPGYEIDHTEPVGERDLEEEAA